MASKRKASKKKAKKSAAKSTPKAEPKKSSAKKEPTSSAKKAKAGGKSSSKNAVKKAATKASKKSTAKASKKAAAKGRVRKKSAVVETKVVDASAKTAKVAAPAEKAKKTTSKKAAKAKPEPKPEEKKVEEKNHRLRSQPVEVQEIDVRIARERYSRIKPFTPRSFGPDPKKGPKPNDLRDTLNRNMGKALPLSARNRPSTVVELGIFAIFALGAKSAKAALEATKRCVTNFADWNEFRISEPYEFCEFLEDLNIPELYDRCERVLHFVGDVYQDMNEVTLEHLRDCTPDDRLELLSRYQSLGPALTHYLGLAIQDFEGVIFHYSWARVGQRSGVLGRSNSPKTLGANLMKAFKGNDLLSVQVNMIELGEEICTSVRPNCKSCCLVQMCVNRKV
ncbi:MAG: hypothetical protein CSA62_04560 [Planctomycetota bacterium]|nr:MAG: hypothetical protein CSA62_04560 [Planctomycetota bacterium]